MTPYFRFLAFAGLLLLWGVSLANGTVKALILAVWHGQFSNGIPLRRRYLGLPPLDLLIALPVAFFFYGSNSTDEGYQLFLLDAYAALQPAFVWLYVEAARPGPKPYWVSRPVAFGALWQCLGGAIALPLYYATHLPWATAGGPARVADASQAAALPWSYALGALVPTLVGMGTTWRGSGSRTDATHQLILGFWQPDPLWVAGLQATLSAVLATTVQRPGQGRAERGHPHAFFWIRSSYFLAAAISALAHLYVTRRLLAGREEPTVNFVRMYVPFLRMGPAGVGDEVLIYGPWLFLQYDFIIIALSSLSWAYCLLTAGVLPLAKKKLILLLLVVAVTLGPGATVSLALFYREGMLTERRGS